MPSKNMLPKGKRRQSVMKDYRAARTVAQERDAVLRRFYRSDKIRTTPGVGLGLNLVAAIVKLHGFRLAIHPGQGGRLEIICPDSQ